MHAFSCAAKDALDLFGGLEKEEHGPEEKNILLKEIGKRIENVGTERVETENKLSTALAMKPEDETINVLRARVDTTLRLIEGLTANPDPADMKHLKKLLNDNLNSIVKLCENRTTEKLYPQI